MPLMRSLLYVPANRPRFVESARNSPADVIVLDLEDSVPPAGKEAARAVAAAAITALKAVGKVVHVRVNAIETGLTRDDLAAVIGVDLAGVDLPKADSPQDVRDLDILMREQETRKNLRAGVIVMVPSIESPRGILRCAEIAAASTRLAGLSLGGFDYAAALGVDRTPAGRELEYARGVVVNCAAANGLQAFDAVFGDVANEAGLAEESAYVKSLGFKGKYVIHPAQVEVVNRVFRPSAAEVEAARKLVAAFDEALARGEGSVQVEGRMVDLPIAKRARDLIALSEEIASR